MQQQINKTIYLHLHPLPLIGLISENTRYVKSRLPFIKENYHASSAT
jgi:hypothetical protein